MHAPDHIKINSAAMLVQAGSTTVVNAKQCHLLVVYVGVPLPTWDSQPFIRNISRH